MSLQRHLNNLNEKGVVDQVLESGGFSGQLHQKGWKLTEGGAEMVRDVLKRVVSQKARLLVRVEIAMTLLVVFQVVGV